MKNIFRASELLCFSTKAKIARYETFIIRVFSFYKVLTCILQKFFFMATWLQQKHGDIKLE